MNQRQNKGWLLIGLGMLGVAALLGSAVPAQAQPAPGAARHQFRGHDVHRFSASELGYWRGGRWNNTCYGGRCGWWWFASGQWFYYPQPIYPYPMMVSTVTYAEPVVMVPAPVVVAPPPQTSVQPGPQFHYYCDNPAGYYPAVQNCSTQFRQVALPSAALTPNK